MNTQQEPDIPGLIPEEKYVVYVDPASKEVHFNKIPWKDLVETKMNKEAFARLCVTYGENVELHRRIVSDIVEKAIEKSEK